MANSESNNESNKELGVWGECQVIHRGYSWFRIQGSLLTGFRDQIKVSCFQGKYPIYGWSLLEAWFYSGKHKYLICLIFFLYNWEWKAVDFWIAGNNTHESIMDQYIT